MKLIGEGASCWAYKRGKYVYLINRNNISMLPDGSMIHGHPEKIAIEKLQGIKHIPKIIRIFKTRADETVYKMPLYRTGNTILKNKDYLAIIRLFDRFRNDTNRDGLVIIKRRSLKTQLDKNKNIKKSIKIALIKFYDTIKKIDPSAEIYDDTNYLNFGYDKQNKELILLDPFCTDTTLYGRRVLS